MGFIATRVLGSASTASRSRSEPWRPTSFQKGDRVVLKESYEDVEGKIVGVWKGDAYRVSWETSQTFGGKTMIVNGGGVKKK